jgi:plasmid stabilization system protein ParE
LTMYVLHRGAEDDLLEAARFYRDEGVVKLAHRFLDEFERVMELLTEFPNIGRPAGDSRRVHPLRSFPHSVATDIPVSLQSR